MNTYTHAYKCARSNQYNNETNELNFVHDAQIKNGCAYAINNRLIRNGFQWMDTQHHPNSETVFFPAAKN